MRDGDLRRQKKTKESVVKEIAKEIRRGEEEKKEFGSEKSKKSSSNDEGRRNSKKRKRKESSDKKTIRRKEEKDRDRESAEETKKLAADLKNSREIRMRKGLSEKSSEQNVLNRMGKGRRRRKMRRNM